MAAPFVVEWVVVVDHPELRDASFRPVPAGLRIVDRKSFATKVAAGRFYDQLRGGELDHASEYIGRVVLLRPRPGEQPKMVRPEVRRTRRGDGQVVQLDKAAAKAQRLRGSGLTVRADVGVNRDVARAIKQQLEREPPPGQSSLETSSASTPEAMSPPPAGQLFSSEAEGFALTAPRGQFGGGGTGSVGTQQELVSRKVDAQKMVEIAERERAERAAARAPAAASTLPIAVEVVLEPEAPSLGVARLEFVDVATGEARSAAAPGTGATGRIVAELDGVAVPIDSEDLIGRGAPADPRARRYQFDRESPADYDAAARRIKAVRHRKSKPPTRPRVPGVQTTFRNPAAAAMGFYQNNAAFFDNVPDPIDGLRDWADGIDVKVSRGRSKRLAKTQHGQRIFAASRGQGQILAALRYVFGQAKGRHWDAVPWQEIDRLEAALQPHYERPRHGGSPGLLWRPAAGPLDVETLDRMPPDVRQRVRDYESHVELKGALEELRTTYRKTSACIPASLRRTVLHRIKAWSSWERAPSKIPAYACEPDERSGGHLCNYPAVEGELRALRRACEEAYDPLWALPEAKSGAPGFPDLSEGEDDVAPPPKPVLLRPPPMPAPAPAQPTSKRAKVKPQRAESPTRPAPIRTAAGKPSTTPSAEPTAPVAARATKKPKSKPDATRSKVEECASLLGKRGAEARSRKRKERLSEEERARVLEEALALAIS